MIIYIVLGIIQGFTEPIPVSSSGHLVIIKNMLKAPFLNDLTFEIFSNFGSFLAIIIIFKKDITKLLKDFIFYIKTKNHKYKEGFNYSLLIITGTLPAAIAGLCLNDFIENNFVNVKYVGFSLLITAFFLFLVRNQTGIKTDDDIKITDALKIGLFQIIALFPGISRSGATLVGGMASKLTRETAFKFSFMLYIPITIATMIFSIKDIANNSLNINLLSGYIIGAISAFIVTLITTKWFRNILLKGKLVYFVYYCLIAGIIVLLFL
ncbi:MAG: undecaprenyl-diphosphate phosphatase [Bacilli bacterium]|nr:undecaprenyl-diphosphate phosphatase [Bacilli bacterium]